MSAPLRPATTTLRRVVVYITSTDRATPCRFIRRVIGIYLAVGLARFRRKEMPKNKSSAVNIRCDRPFH